MMEKRLSHAYMLVSAQTENAREEAKKLASALLCGGEKAPCGRCRDCRKMAAGVHPDYIPLLRQKDDKGNLRREIYVDQIRAMTADAAVAPNESRRKVYVIEEAGRMNVQAQNALLKVLEDPPGHACFILCTPAADALLPTVRSRCVRLDGARETAENGAVAPFAREYLQLAGENRRAMLMQFCMNRSKLSREEALAFVEGVRDALWQAASGRQEDHGLTKEKIFRLGALMDRAERMLRRNLGTRQVFGVLAAETLR